MQDTWAGLSDRIDPQRHRHVAAFLQIQHDEAQWWRDASVAYFQSLSGRPLPAGERPPPQPLSYYRALQFPFAPGMADEQVRSGRVCAVDDGCGSSGDAGRGAGDDGLLHPLFRDHAVLQRDRPIAVWGTQALGSRFP